MKVVCRILRGQLFPRDDVEMPLEKFEPYATTFYHHKPRMIKYRSEGVNLLIFTTLRFRLMGGGKAHESVLHQFLKTLPWQMHVSGLTLASMTVTHHLHSLVNLHKLTLPHFSTELELFPASKFIHKGKAHVNIFHTGRIVITGVRDINKTQHHLLPQITHNLKHAFYS